MGGYIDHAQEKVVYTPEGPIAIANAIRNSASLTRIDLWGNNLGRQGAKHIAEGIAVSASLTSIDLSQCAYFKGLMVKTLSTSRMAPPSASC